MEPNAWDEVIITCSCADSSRVIFSVGVPLEFALLLERLNLEKKDGDGLALFAEPLLWFFLNGAWRNEM